MIITTATVMAVILVALGGRWFATKATPRNNRG
jgi:hypothetical protein